MLTDPLLPTLLDEEQRHHHLQGGRFRRREAAALEAPGPRGHGCVRTSSTPPSSAPSCSNSPEPRRRRCRRPPPTPIIRGAAAMAAQGLLLLAAVPMRRRSSNRFSSGMAEATGGRWGRCTSSAWPGPTPMITSRRAHTPSAAGASRPPLVAMSAGIRRSPRTLASCKTRSTVKPHAKSPTSFVYLCLCLLF